jgi:hypothetical protein
MKKILLVGLLALGLLLLATFALAADTTTTAKDTTTGTQLRCCNHAWVDANNDGKCDTCGMAYEDIAKFNQTTSGCTGCTGCSGGHGHGGNH